jgi:hypothetical protein
MPLIFASSLLGLPLALARLTDNAGLERAAEALGPGGSLYLPVNVALIAFFNYYYTFLQVCGVCLVVFTQFVWLRVTFSCGSAWHSSLSSTTDTHFCRCVHMWCGCHVALGSAPRVLVLVLYVVDRQMKRTGAAILSAAQPSCCASCFVLSLTLALPLFSCAFFGAQGLVRATHRCRHPLSCTILSLSSTSLTHICYFKALQLEPKDASIEESEKLKRTGPPSSQLHNHTAVHS